MKSRIQKQKPSAEDICMTYETEVIKETTYSTIDGRKVSEKDMQSIMNVLDRHTPLDPNDIFGRSFMCANATENIRANKWPELKTNVLMANTGAFSQYKIMSNEMLQEYAALLIKKGLMQSPDILQKLPVIDLRRNFKRTFDKEIETIGLPDVKTDDDDIMRLRQAKTDIFKPRFNDVCVRWNKNLYEHIKINTIDDDVYEITYETYIGDGDPFWMLTKRGVVTFKPKCNADWTMSCDLSIKDGVSYERILSEYLPEMKWDAKKTTMWCDIFGVAQDWKSVMGAVMKPTDETPYEDVQILFNSKESSLMRRVYGDDIYLITNHNDLDKKLDASLMTHIVTRIAATLSFIYLMLHDTAPNKVTELDNGKLKQVFDKIIVTSDKPWYYNE